MSCERKIHPTLDQLLIGRFLPSTTHTPNAIRDRTHPSSHQAITCKTPSTSTNQQEQRRVKKRIPSSHCLLPVRPQIPWRPGQEGSHFFQQPRQRLPSNRPLPPHYPEAIVFSEDDVSADRHREEPNCTLNSPPSSHVCCHPSWDGPVPNPLWSSSPNCSLAEEEPVVPAPVLVPAPIPATPPRSRTRQW